MKRSRGAVLVLSLSLSLSLTLAGAGCDSGDGGSGGVADTGGGGVADTGGGGTADTGGGGTADTGGGGVADTGGGGTADTGGGGTADTGGGTVVTTDISAAAGGTVEAAGGEASLAIPAGALPADTTITVASLPSEAGTEAPVFDFGPDGLQFTTPVTLSIAFDGLVPEGKKAALAWFDEAAGTWTAIEGSTTAGGKVQGPVSHFTKFSVILTGDTAIVVSECDDLVNGFDACGGDPTGQWTFKDVCMLQSLGDNPFENCPGSIFEGDVSFDGTFEVKDGTVTTTMNKQTLFVHIAIPMGCLPPGIECVGIFKAEDGWLCGELGGNCDCTKNEEQVPSEPVTTETYTIAGSTLTMGDGQTLDFCATADELKARWKDANGTDQYMIVADKVQ